MEFTQYTCPVCEKRFENGDDVVVCPECGAPHHRECFENLGHCFYEDQHAPGFSFENAGKEEGDGEETPDVVICPNCQAENERTSFYCNKCGFPLNSEDRTQQQNTQTTNNAGQTAQGMPFGFGGAGNPSFDPLAGLDSEAEIAENVKVGEAAKYIGKSTPYYLAVFNRIRQFASGRFNFSAFLLSGAYFIYRKMYVIGIIFSLIMIGITVGSTALVMTNPWMSHLEYNELINGGLSSERMTVLMISAGLNLLRYAIMIFSGLFANKLYYRHCTKQINRIKSENAGGELNKTLEEKGGVNLPMAISFFVTFVVIYELCNFYIIFNT